MKEMSPNVEALRMQIIRLIVAIDDETYLSGIREALHARCAESFTQAVEMNDLEKVSIEHNSEQPRFRSSDEVRVKLWTKLKSKVAV